MAFGWSYAKKKIIQRIVTGAAQAAGAKEQNAKKIGHAVGLFAGVAGGILTLDIVGLIGSISEELIESAGEEAFEYTGETLTDSLINEFGSEAIEPSTHGISQYVHSETLRFGQQNVVDATAQVVSNVGSILSPTDVSTFSEIVSSLDLPETTQNIWRQAVESDDGELIARTAQEIIKTFPSNRPDQILMAQQILQVPSITFGNS